MVRRAPGRVALATAVDIRTRDCKTPGCPRIADHARGPLAGLCEEHAKAQRRAIAERNTLRAADPAAVAAPKPALPVADGEPSTADRTRELAGDVDRKTKNLARDREAVRRSSAELHAAEQAYQALLRSLLPDAQAAS